MPTDEGVFDDEKVRQIVKSVGLPLDQKAASTLREELEAVGWDYHFTLAAGPTPQNIGKNQGIQAISGPEIAPFTVRDRLERIKQATERAYANSWSKSEQQAASLLELLGYRADGKPRLYSGTEKTGHGGSERSAIWLFLVQAVTANERPPRGYRRKPNQRPWTSQRLNTVIEQLVAFCADPSDKQRQESARAEAESLYGWAKWSVRVASGQVKNRNHNRHIGDYAINAIFPELARIYTEAFGQKPTTSIRSERKDGAIQNPWHSFLNEVLERLGVPCNKRTQDGLLHRTRSTITKWN